MKKSFIYNQSKLFVVNVLLLTLFFLQPLTVSTFADSIVGGSLNSKIHVAKTDSTDNNNGLKKFYSITGKYYLSVDGGGSLDNNYSVLVNKPNSQATVIKAFLIATSTGKSGYKISDTDIKLNNETVKWDNEVQGVINIYNYYTDVTSILKTKIDGENPGMINIEIYEENTSTIEGTILAVVFDDPSITVDKTKVLLFGSQKMEGDTFSITLNDEMDLTSNKSEVNMGLGISFGCQGSCGNNITPQYSIVKVNGSILTSSAGGQDDGGLHNGSLITVGGINDSIENPTDPNKSPDDNDNCRIDDELYSLLPFMNSGDRVINVYTQNPSNDDNILFAYFELPPAKVQECEISDNDQDGVIDQWDNCPDTPKNSCVNNKGCSCELTLIDENGSVAKGDWKTYYATVEDTYSNIKVKLQNLTDDIDLYVKKGNQPDFDHFDCRPYKGGQRDESCYLNNNGENVWFFKIYGYKSGEYTISVKAKP